MNSASRFRVLEPLRVEPCQAGSRRCLQLPTVSVKTFIVQVWGTGDDDMSLVDRHNAQLTAFWRLPDIYINAVWRVCMARKDRLRLVVCDRRTKEFNSFTKAFRLIHAIIKFVSSPHHDQFDNDRHFRLSWDISSQNEGIIEWDCRYIGRIYGRRLKVS